MQTVTSKDGTLIAFDRSGRGPALILVDGALEHRAFGSITARLAGMPLLRQHFTVINYDRRGRGDSTDAQPYAVEREIEDIEALIDAAGGSASLFGISSGAALAMEAALALGGKVKMLALYEPPYNSEEASRQAWRQYRKDLAEMVAANRRGDALARFMMLTGMPPEQLDEARQLPSWPAWEAVALTLAYDAAVLGEDAAVPGERMARLAAPTLVISGDESFPFMHATAAELARAIPDGRHLALPGQTHEVDPEVLAPVLVEFLGQTEQARG